MRGKRRLATASRHRPGRPPAATRRTRRVRRVSWLSVLALFLAGCGMAAALDGGTGTGAGAVTAPPVRFLLRAHPRAAGLRPALRALPAPTPPPAPPAPPPPRHYQPGRPVRVLFLGDSTAETTAAGLVPLAPRYGESIDNQGIPGCGVVTDGPYDYFGSRYPTVLPQCQLWAFSWAGAVSRDDPDVVAVMIGRWELMDRFWRGRWTHVGDPAYDAYLVSLYDAAVSIASSRGARVALFTDPYFLRGHRPDGGIWPEDQPGRVDIMNGLFRQVAESHPGVVSLVDLGGRLSPGGRFAMTIDGVRVRSDGVHMTPQAGAWLAPWLLPQLRAIGASA